MGREKLTPIQRAAIREWRRQGRGTREICELLARDGVTVTGQTIRNVVKRRVVAYQN